ncbi:MAG: hypothetical protein B7C24_09750 [Bacteroidetes bacterium 4572_77]|nr:MAG: hypothetical protein B7C24_09750 [Bacteroidetes bacterium 4572_77]
MNIKLLSVIFLISLFVSSCGTQKTTLSLNQKASMAADTGNYEQATKQWEAYLAQNQETENPVNAEIYAQLGKAYFHLERFDQSEAAFDQARFKNYADADMYLMMSKNYHRIDNLSKEITVLEYYKDHLSPQGDSSFMRKRLFQTYVVSENWDLAEQAWQVLGEDSKKEADCLQDYFVVNKALKKNEKCDTIALELLKVDAKNRKALDWMAKKYYDRAENRYQKSMNYYNKHKSTKNYNKLLKELDRVTADFKKSLKYFDQLWEMEDGHQYASYLANIYARFSDKKKSQYYKKFM